jgi:hypothetical protein
MIKSIESGVSVNPADLVRRCASETCHKSFQGNMPSGWERLGVKAGRTLSASDTNIVLCPKHAQERLPHGVSPRRR